jgi:hypothetical protein
MTPEQSAILLAHIRSNPAVASFLTARNDTAIADWYNTPSTTKAWRADFTKEELFSVLNLTSYDGLTAGKRDSFRLIFDNAPVNFCNDRIRAGVVDIFSATDEAAMLNAATEFASNLEMVFGGAVATSAAITAIKRNFVGDVTSWDISVLLNNG